MKYLIFSFVICFSFGLKAQKIYDKEADLLLQKVSDKIKDAEQLVSEFTLTFKAPGSEDVVENGKLIQDKTSYFVSFADTEVIQCKEGFYLIDKNSKSVQINDPIGEETKDIYNPVALMETYDSGEYEYAITGEEMVNGERCFLVEFKPADRYSELSKIRVAVSSKTELPVYIKFFNKDATRIDIDVLKMILKDQNEEKIAFDKEKYPDYSLEDLRID